MRCFERCFESLENEAIFQCASVDFRRGNFDGH